MALLALRLAGALAIIAAETLAGAFAVGLNPTTIGFVYLVTVLVIATAWGMPTAAAASVAATVCFNYFFLPPLHTFNIADPQNWVALFAFLAAALLTSQLSERARRRTQEALARQRELEQLHAVSRAILSSSGAEPLGTVLAAEISRAYRTSLTAIYDAITAELFCIPDALPPEIEHKLRDAALNGGVFRDDTQPSYVTAFGITDHPQGSLALVGVAVSSEAVQSLANLAAIGLEKSRSQKAASRAEAARRTQEFKSTLLDALAHEFKTPLTAIKAAATSMAPGMTAPEQHSDLAAVIEEEADHLNALMNEAIHLSRIEAGKARLEKKRCLLHSLVREAARPLESALGGRMVLEISDDIPAVLADEELIAFVIRQLLDNALKYSPAESPIRVRASRSADLVRIGVWNEGAPIPEWEAPRLFDRFYRGSTAGAQTTGIGMGLAIASEIVSAHGGRMRIESSAARGTEVSLSLPFASEGVAA